MPPRPTSQTYGRGGALGAQSRVVSGTPGAETIQRAERDFHARRILVNSATPLTKYSLVEVHDGDSDLDASIALIQAHDISFPNGNGATINNLSSRGTIGAPIIVQDTDGLGQWQASGWDGTEYNRAVWMLAQAVEVQSGHIGGQWTIYVAPRNDGNIRGAIQATADPDADDQVIVSIAPSSGDEILVYNTNLATYINSVVTGGLQIVTGSYTGDGGTSQAITGLGITPKLVHITRRIADVSSPARIMSQDGDWVWTQPEILDDDASGGSILLNGSQWEFDDDHIIALGSGSFTVDDNGADEHPNASGVVYNYWCIGS